MSGFDIAILWSLGVVLIFAAIVAWFARRKSRNDLQGLPGPETPLVPDAQEGHYRLRLPAQDGRGWLN